MKEVSKMSVIEVKNLCKTFRVKKKEKGLKGSFKSLWQPNCRKGRNDSIYRSKWSW